MIQMAVYVNRETIGVVTVTNDETGTPERGNYTVRVSDEVVGRVVGFDRRRGIWSLMSEALKVVK